MLRVNHKSLRKLGQVLGGLLKIGNLGVVMDSITWSYYRSCHVQPPCGTGSHVRPLAVLMIDPLTT